MQSCIEKNQTGFEFVINTNASKINKRFLELSSKFSNLQFIISIDGFMKVNDYVRWLSEWDTIVNNSNRLSINHKISFNATVSIYTISRLDQLLEFFDTFFPKILVHCQLAESLNDILSPYNYPNWKEIRNKLVKIKNLNCYKNDRLLQSFIDGMIDANPTLDINKLKQFYEFNDTLDQSRNVKLVDYIPELDKFRTWC
jgi:sulfatase maturation enzyme AslB (radical SAM superfamily)